jgi:Ca2+-binding EF-hand superfamily protein
MTFPEMVDAKERREKQKAQPGESIPSSYDRHLPYSATGNEEYRMISYEGVLPAGWVWATHRDVKVNLEAAKKVFTEGTYKYWVALADGFKIGGEGYEYKIAKIENGEKYKNRMIYKWRTSPSQGTGKLDNFKKMTYDDPIPDGWFWATVANVQANLENAKLVFDHTNKFDVLALSDGWKIGGSGMWYAITQNEGREKFRYKLIVQDNKKVQKGKFNEHNNDLYRYLRSVGNDWFYDPEKVDPNTRKRLLSRFDTFDLDKDGDMSIEEVKMWPERMREMCGASDEQIENMVAANEEFFICHGVHPEHGCKREDWVENNRIFQEYERERIRQGLQPIINKLDVAYFDVLDQDGNGYLDFDELKCMIKVLEIPVAAADSFFRQCDTDGDGKLDFQEIHVQFTKFWFSEYDNALDHVIANKY